MGPGGGTCRAATAGAPRGAAVPGLGPGAALLKDGGSGGGSAAELLGTRCGLGRLRASAPWGGSGPAGRAVSPPASLVARGRDCRVFTFWGRPAVLGCNAAAMNDALASMGLRRRKERFSVGIIVAANQQL